MIAIEEQNKLTEALHNSYQRDAPVERLRRLDWPALEQELNAQGSTVLKGVLSSEECSAIAHWYSEDARFRGMPGRS